MVGWLFSSQSNQLLIELNSHLFFGFQSPNGVKPLTSRQDSNDSDIVEKIYDHKTATTRLNIKYFKKSNYSAAAFLFTFPDVSHLLVTNIRPKLLHHLYLSVQSVL